MYADSVQFKESMMKIELSFWQFMGFTFLLIFLVSLVWWIDIGGWFVNLVIQEYC